MNIKTFIATAVVALSLAACDETVVMEPTPVETGEPIEEGENRCRPGRDPVAECQPV